MASHSRPTKAFLFLASLGVFQAGATSWADSPPRGDRRLAESNGWIYDNFDAGIEKAKETGKPLMVVLRCPP